MAGMPASFSQATPAPVGTKPAPVVAAAKPPLQPNKARVGPESLVSTLNAEVAEAKANSAKIKTDLEGITSGFHTKMGELKALMPKPPEMKKFEPPEQVDPIAAFGSSAGLLAGIASLFTRTPLTTSLKAMTAGMQAIQQGNAHAYEKAFEEWQENTDYAFKAFDEQNKAYDQMIDLAKTDYDAAIRGITQIAAMTDDQVMMTVSQMGELSKIENLNISRAELNMKTQEAAFNVGVPAKILSGKIAAYKVQNGGQSPPPEKLAQMYQEAKNGGASGGMLATAEMIAKGQIPMPTGYALTRMGGNELVTMVKQLKPDFSATLYPAKQNALKAFYAGDRGRLVTAANVGIQHLAVLEELMDALHNGDVPRANAIRQRFAAETGVAAPTNMDAAKQIVGDEIVKFVAGGGRGAGAVFDREEIGKNLNRSGSPAQMKGLIGTYKHLMAGQLDGQRKQYEATGLEDIQPFDTYLMPETIQALSNLSPGAAGGNGEDLSHLWGGR